MQPYKLSFYHSGGANQSKMSKNQTRSSPGDYLPLSHEFSAVFLAPGLVLANWSRKFQYILFRSDFLEFFSVFQDAFNCTLQHSGTRELLLKGLLPPHHLYAICTAHLSTQTASVAGFPENFQESFFNRASTEVADLNTGTTPSTGFDISLFYECALVTGFSCFCKIVTAVITAKTDALDTGSFSFVTEWTSD
jgi:hypothetical protein